LRRNTPPAHSLKTTTGIDTLTRSERNILRLIAEQKTTKTIAEELFISPKTVDKHRTNICAKLDLHGAYALLKFAFENKSRI
jgi:DNA-binding CsgD family transcriptional regulator